MRDIVNTLLSYATNDLQDTTSKSDRKDWKTKFVRMYASASKPAGRGSRLYLTWQEEN